MSLLFVRSPSKTERDVFRRSQDDIYARGPILIANRYFNPLTDYIPSGVITKSWRLAASCTDDLVDGRRFENATWRLWGQQQFNLKRISNSDVDWETVLGWPASGKANSLLVPVIVSKDTCRGSHELPLLCAFHGLLPAPAPSWLLSPGSVPMGPISVGETSSISVKPCIKSDTSSSNSHSRDSPLSFRNVPLPTSSPTVQQHPGPRVVFNSYVEQSIIIDASVIGEKNDSGSETDVVAELGLNNDEILLKRRSRAFDSLSYNKDSGEGTDEEPTPAAPKIIRCATPKRIDFVFIQALPPIQIFPKVEDAERGVTVIFVPPKAHRALKEADVLPAKTKPPRPTSKLRRTLSSHNLATVIKDEMAEMAMGEMGSARSRSTTNLGGARAHGGWPILNGSDSSGEEELLLSKVTKRRRLREKRTEVKVKIRFSFGDEDEEGDDERGGGLSEGWETISAPEEQCGDEDGDGAASGRIADLQIQACVQGSTHGVHGTVETSFEAGVYRGWKEGKEGVPSTIGTIIQAFDEEATQASESGVGGAVDADVEEVVNGVVELGDAGVWVEQGHGEEGSEVQAALTGPLAVIASWVKPAIGLRFWKK